jgi:putative aminopeptidase FrvX
MAILSTPRRVHRWLFAWTFLALVVPVVAQTQPGANDRVERLLEELSNAPGPSGFEGPVRALLVRELREQGLEISTDGLGSVVGVLPGATGGPRIMLVSHMDEVGGMVRMVTEEGMVKFQLLGGWLDQALVDQRWTILTSKGPVVAVSGARSVHVTTPEDRLRVTPRDDVFLDIGATSKKEAELMGVRPGDAIVPASSFSVLGHGRYVGKAIDDRVGCVMMIEVLRRLKERGIKTPNTVYFVGSVQEELGLRGAHSAVAKVQPDLGISLEAGIAGDYPGGRHDLVQEVLGGGPVLYLADHRMLVNQRLRQLFEQVAQEKGIPVQTEVTNQGEEDSAEVQQFGTGKPAMNFAIPTRYLHNHNSVMQRSDLDQAIELLINVLMKLDARKVAEISHFE